LFHEICAHNITRFVTAQDWGQLRRLVWENTLGGFADPMIELVDRNRSSAVPIPGRNIRRIAFSAVSDIPALLRSELGGYLVPTSLQVAGLPSVKTQELSSEQPVDDGSPWHNEDVADMHLTEQQEELAPDAIERTDIEAVAFTAGDTDKSKTQQVYNTDDYEKVQKAVAIYRRIRTSSSMTRTFGKQVLFRSGQFKAFLRQAQLIDWTSRSVYRKIYLWACPHLLSALHGIHQVLVAKRHALKKMLADPKTDHLKFDELMEQMIKLK
jgi:hypothetical protein